MKLLAKTEESADLHLTRMEVATIQAALTWVAVDLTYGPGKEATIEVGQNLSEALGDGKEFFNEAMRRVILQRKGRK